MIDYSQLFLLEFSMYLIKSPTVWGHFAGSVGRACKSWYWDHELKPDAGVEITFFF